MKALVFDVNVNEIVQLIQEARANKEAYLGEHSLLRLVDTPARFEWSPHYFKEINLVGSNAFGVEEWNGKRQHAMRHYFEMIQQKSVDVTPIITHRFPLEDFKDAFLYTHNQGEHGAVKVLFDFGT